MGFGPTELFIIFAIVMLLFGAGKLPKLARSMGTAVTEFKQGIQGVKEEAAESLNADKSSSEAASAPAQQEEKAEQS